MIDENIKKNEDKNEEEEKSLNERIKDLVDEMEKNNYLISKIYSWKNALWRGLFYGLGIVIGSTIFAGFLYSLAVNILGEDLIKEMTLEYIINQEEKKDENN